MSRIPPLIEQVIDGKKVDGWEILPIFDDAGVQYKLSMQQKYDKSGMPIGLDLYISAHSPDGNEKWKTKYFSREYIPFLETDIQETFPVDFYLKDNLLVIKLEHYSENDGIFYVMKDEGGIKLKSLH